MAAVSELFIDCGSPGQQAKRGRSHTHGGKVGAAGGALTIAAVTVAHIEGLSSTFVTNRATGAATSKGNRHRRPPGECVARGNGFSEGREEARHARAHSF